MNARRLAPALAALALATACGGSDESADPAPSTSARPSGSASASPSESLSPAVVNNAIKAVAKAEEDYFADRKNYLGFIKTVPPALGVKDPISADVRVAVGLISTKGYCVIALRPVDGRFAVYDSTRGGIQRDVRSLQDLTPVCVATARKLAAAK